MNEQPIRDLVFELLARKGAAPLPADEEPLLSSGLLDSVDVLEIVAFLEQRHGIDFAARPFDPYDFDTIAAIVRRVARDAA